MNIFTLGFVIHFSTDRNLNTTFSYHVIGLDKELELEGSLQRKREYMFTLIASRKAGCLTPESTYSRAVYPIMVAINHHGT